MKRTIEIHPILEWTSNAIRHQWPLMPSIEALEQELKEMGNGE